jgi:plastocyanin
MHKRVHALNSLTILILFSACGGGGTDVVEPPGPVTSVTVNSPSTTTTVGGSLQMSALAKDAKGVTVTGQTAAWISSNTSVATVNSSSGLVTGVALGTTTITGTVSGINGTKLITVANVPSNASVAATPALVFDPAQVDIAAGGSITWQFGATGHTVVFDGTATGKPANIGNETANTSLSRTFTTAGTFPYHCSIHAGMNGTVIVH